MKRRNTLGLMAAVLITPVFLSACGQGAPETTTVANAVIMPPLPGRDTALGTLLITGGADGDTLLSASSPISPRVEIHTHTMDGGVMKMRRVESVEIAAGKTVKFKRGGYHLMMFDSTLEEGVTEVPLTLTFESGAINVTAMVDVE